MRIVCKVWPSRLLATLIALALLASYPIGAFVHAAEHHAAAHQTVEVAGGEDAGGPAGHDAQHHASAATSGTCQHVLAGGAAGDDGAGHSRDCCDSVCHGGHAVVADAPPVPHVPPGHPAIEPMAAIDGAKPGGRYRPPIALHPA